MRQKIITIILVLTILGALFYAASGRVATRYVDMSKLDAEVVAEPVPQNQNRTKPAERRMVDA